MILASNEGSVQFQMFFPRRRHDDFTLLAEYPNAVLHDEVEFSTSSGLPDVWLYTAFYTKLFALSDVTELLYHLSKSISIVHPGSRQSLYRGTNINTSVLSTITVPTGLKGPGSGLTKQQRDYIHNLPPDNWWFWAGLLFAFHSLYLSFLSYQHSHPFHGFRVRSIHPYLSIINTRLCTPSLLIADIV